MSSRTKSSTTTSGVNKPIAVSAACPSLAVPTTSHVCPSRAAMRARSCEWSSTTTIRLRAIGESDDICRLLGVVSALRGVQLAPDGRGQATRPIVDSFFGLWNDLRLDAARRLQAELVDGA